MTPRPIELYKTASNSDAFARKLADLPGFVFLKSAHHAASRQKTGRFDIISAKPVTTTASPNALTLPTIPNLDTSKVEHLPFLWGWIGAAAYDDSKTGTERSENKGQDARSAKSIHWFSYYSWSYCFDHKLNEGWLIFAPDCDAQLRDAVLEFDRGTINDKLDLRTCQTRGQRLLDLAWEKSQSFEQYAYSFNRIQEYIQAGDCYQANLTQRFETKAELDPTQQLELFLEQCDRSIAKYCAYMSLDEERSILSFSPERFIEVQNGKVSTSPIKGTIKSEGDLDDTQKAILESDKNKAENLMIVDLLRNDLSKSCTLNSVRVDKLFEIQSFENVHHLVSTITGDLLPDVNAMQAFWNAFPGGSITGAPKIRAMEIIEELEQHSRSYYCGSVFYWDVRGNLDSSILIRTLVKQKNDLYCWAGGGIVADSDLQAEYQESIDKVSHITGILE